MKLERVVLKQSSDPNQTGYPLGSARLQSKAVDPEKGFDRLELDPTGCWVVVNGKRAIPRELVLHVDYAEESDAKGFDGHTFAPEGTWDCQDCGKPCASNAGLAAHRRKAHPEPEA